MCCRRRVGTRPTPSPPVNMVTVDMSKTRQQISKRKRRLRRLQRRRLQKVRRQQHAQLIAAGAARKARQEAVQNWHEEEKRRAKQPRSQPRNKPRVRFADNVSVTEIPTVPEHSLPKPVSSPTGVRLVKDTENDPPLDAALLGVCGDMQHAFTLLCASDDDYDEDDDPDFVPGVLAEHADVQLPVAVRPKRRLIPQQLPVPDTSASKPAKAHNNPSHNSSHNSSPASTPPKSCSSRDKPLKQSAEHNKNASSSKPNGIVKSPKRKRSHSKMLSTENEKSPSASPDAAESKTSPINASDSPRRRKKKKRKLSNTAQTDNSAQHQPKSPTPADNKHSPKKVQPTAGQAQSNVNSPQLNPVLATVQVNKQNGAVANGASEDSDIDDMFGQMVRRKAQVRAEQRNRKKVANANAEKPVGDGDKGKSHKRKGPTRYTEEGFRIMSYDEIKADQPAGLNGGSRGLGGTHFTNLDTDGHGNFSKGAVSLKHASHACCTANFVYEHSLIVSLIALFQLCHRMPA
ncbi:hypothetical protein FGB62_67g010 [Gracilaria domingensis]|nr:hypothetical protein FGB62_67g010 [Gracilaria domingensis]